MRAFDSITAVMQRLSMFVAFAALAGTASAQTTATLKPVTDMRPDWMGLLGQSPGGRHLLMDSYAGDTLHLFDRVTNTWARVPDAARGASSISPNGRFLASLRRSEGSDRRFFLWITPTDSATSMPNGPARRVSVRPANQVAWSRDSRRVAYLSSDSGKTRLVVAPFNGGADSVLFEADGSASSIDWTADGNAIVFALRPKPDMAPRVMRHDIAAKRTVAGPILEGPRILGFSKDGRHIASRDAVTNSIVVHRVSDFKEVQRVELPIRQWLDPLEWSARDDHSILAIDRYLPSHIQRVDFATGKLTPLFAADSTDTGATTYSPDGSRIAFLRGTRLGRRVVIVDADGSDPRTVGTAGKFQSLAWSPKGNAILTCDDTSIRVVDLSTGSDRVLARGALFVGRASEPCSWRADGNAIRYIVRNTAAPVFERQIREVSLAGADRVLSSFRTGGATQLLNDSTLLLLTLRGLTQRHVTTGKESVLHTGEMGGRLLFLSPDKTTLAFVASEGVHQIPRLLDLRTRAVRRVPYSLGGEVAQVKFHPDGKHLLLEACLSCVETGYTEKWDVVQLPINGDPARVLTAPLRGYKDFAPIAISPDGRSGVFGAQPSYNTRIVSLTLPPLR